MEAFEAGHGREEASVVLLPLLQEGSHPPHGLPHVQPEAHPRRQAAPAAQALPAFHLLPCLPARILRHPLPRSTHQAEGMQRSIKPDRTLGWAHPGRQARTAASPPPRVGLGSVVQYVEDHLRRRAGPFVTISDHMIEEVAEFLRGFWRQHQDAIVSDISDTTPQTTQSAALDRSQLSGFVSEALSRLVGKLNEAIHDDDTRSAATSPSTGDSRAASIIIASPDDSRAASIITASPEGALVPYPTPPPMLMHPFDKVCEVPAVAVIPQPLVPAANFDSFGGAYPSLGDHECYKWEGFDLEGWNFSLPEGHIELPNLELNEVLESHDEKMIRSDT